MMRPLLVPLSGLLGLILLEIFGFALMGDWIGPFLTLLLVIVTAVGGLWVIRLQGAGQLSRIQRAMDGGELPALELLSTAMLPIAAILLMFPGLFTDLAGLVLLVPAIRTRLASAILRRWGDRVRARQGSAPGQGPGTIEGSFRRRDPERLQGSDDDR